MLYAWIRSQEDQAADARQTFQLTMLAIGACFGKDGSKIAKGVMTALEGGALTAEEIADQLSPDAQLVLFGSKRGRKANPDSGQN